MSAMDFLISPDLAAALWMPAVPGGCSWESAFFSNLEMHFSPFLVCNIWYFYYATNTLKTKYIVKYIIIILKNTKNTIWKFLHEAVLRQVTLIE